MRNLLISLLAVVGITLFAGVVGCASEDSDTAEGADSAAEDDTEAQDNTANE